MTDWTSRLAIVSDEAADDFAQAVGICLPEGVRAYELRKLGDGRVPDVSEAAINMVIEQAEAHDLELIGVSPGFFKQVLSDPQTESTFASGLARTFKLMDRLGVRRMTVFSFKREGPRDRPIPAAVVEQLRRARDLCQQAGVEMLIENSASTWADTGANLAYLAQELGVGVTWDPGNAAAAGDTAYPDGYRAVRGHIAHVHFKNWQPGVGNVSINAGVVDIAGQVQALRNDAYAGYYCVEPHQWDDRARASRENIQQLLALLQGDSYD